MNIIFLLIPLSIVLVAVAAWAFFWAVGNGQFDDLDTPAWRILADDENERPAPVERDTTRRDGNEP